MTEDEMRALTDVLAWDSCKKNGEDWAWVDPRGSWIYLHLGKVREWVGRPVPSP